VRPELCITFVSNAGRVRAGGSTRVGPPSMRLFRARHSPAERSRCGARQRPQPGATISDVRPRICPATVAAAAVTRAASAARAVASTSAAGNVSATAAAG
jgi:hypothetical protein